ncbi:hypothetical protein predicted by Glimmer/Critica [Sorangium cellulosum So ce56]|uniref:Uncharacterized protein n=1 Tax=Sorangium cellulosum (strain So ce56) TaxID=448385 RepID=A9GUU7_SORC5|nr:hypothetical protein [Sorangium cellulosum]CAN90669.1 hypothetical protein predicted by Glimmer/Critica [Sorangium cellulosum So ce56]
MSPSSADPGPSSPPGSAAPPSSASSDGTDGTETATSRGAGPAAPPGWLDRLVAAWPRVDPVLFAAYAGVCVLYAAVAFYSAMHQQTGGMWSAPLDDVFIHFDYARATARGYPFEWSEGNGFSSGNTSLSYPFVLALGYLVGFRGVLLMQWAAIVACTSMLGFLLVGARLLEPVGRWAKYLLPPVALSIGALDWSLFSGMENAFHLGVWALATLAALSVARAADATQAMRTTRTADDARAEAPPKRIAHLGWAAGLAGALLYATRPESVVCVAALSVYAAIAVKRAHGARAAIATLLRTSVPGALACLAQAVANRVFTGEWAASGAIAKLALNNPYMTSSEKWDTYEFLATYVVARNTNHHFSDALPWGWLVPALALIPLASRRTRGAAALLWVQVVGWLALVALNGQVRWQNERYTMPAVAWLLVLTAMGLALLVARAAWANGGERRQERPESAPAGIRARLGALGAIAAAARGGALSRGLWCARVALALAVAALFWAHQLPRMRDQIWFFGRASRNIRDQHLVAGKLLAQLDVRRVLVGDAGALLYASDRPGLDIIGLGGYHDLPFARAGVHGLGASLELIERIPADDRPDTLAIYPGWWGDLPAIFGRRIAAIPVVGNVICGGAEKVIYQADWSPLAHGEAPASMREDERIVDELDVADLVSEREHGYAFPRPQAGFVGFSVLPDPRGSGQDRFDAGRVIPGGRSEVARLHAPREGQGRLVVRTAAPRAATIRATADGREIGHLALKRGDGWTEASLDLPEGLPETFTLTLTPVDGEWVDHHVWILDRPARGAGARPLAGQ